MSEVGRQELPPSFDSSDRSKESLDPPDSSEARLVEFVWIGPDPSGWFQSSPGGFNSIFDLRQELSDSVVAL